MSAALHRQAFKQSRLSEYFTEKELSMQIGGAPADWPFILVKELIDNGLDAAEATTAPVIDLTIEADRFTVTDNGHGLPDEVITASLDYSARVSTKAFYVSPTRGRLGNALKVVYAAPFVAHGKAGQVVIDTPSARHVVTITYDAILQLPTLDHAKEAPTVKNGTSVTVHWPDEASYNGKTAVRRFLRLLATFAAVNPHATFTCRSGGESRVYTATDPDWRKWHVDKPTPAHWYTTAQMRALIAAHLKHDDTTTLRQFVGQFAGLSGTQKQKGVIEAASVGTALGDLVTDDGIDETATTRLMHAMREASKAPKPRTIGVIGRKHLEAWIATQARDTDPISYRIADGTLRKGRAEWPYVIEVAVAVIRDEVPRNIHIGVNWSAPTKPLAFLDVHLNRAQIEPTDPLMIVVSIAIAEAAFSDHGKSRLELDTALMHDVGDMIVSAAKPWTKYKNKILREQKASWRRYDDRQKQAARQRYNATSAANEPGVMAAAYRKASGDGLYPANARQIMYAIRGVIIEMVGKASPWKHSSTFTQIILPDYLDAHPDETGAWDVVFDDRGHFAEPHTGVKLGLGTVAVRDYIAAWTDGQGAQATHARHLAASDSLTTKGPLHRFRFALFIEKEGFQSLLDRAQFAERYDLAIFSTKGMSTTAARALVEALAVQGVTILTLHDFDKSGLKIHHTLTNDTRRYRFKVRPTVIDLGLRLSDVEAMSLESEVVEYSSAVDPRDDIRASGGTEAEANFLVSGGTRKDWRGARVELNAMTSVQFVKWLDAKLVEVGVTKIVPDGDILASAYQRVRRAAMVEAKTAAIVREVNRLKIEPPGGLMDVVTQRLQQSPAISWDAAIAEIARQEVA